MLKFIVKPGLWVLALIFCGGMAVYAQSKQKAAPLRTLSMAEFEDKVRGGWAGQMIGVTYGAPTEFRFLQRINDQPRNWKPEELAGALDQDDLYVEMTFAAVMDQVGLSATTGQYGEAFRDSKYQLWHANLAARRLLRRGVRAPMSGNPSYNLHANDIDFQIESDFIGMMCPGLPRAAQHYAERVGHVMNYGDGVYGGVFISAMYSAAFFEKDPRKVVEAGLAAMPPGSVYADVIADVLKWSAENPDWKKTWQRLEEKWDKDDPCPDGALRPFNIDASLNGAYVALGLLYGGGNFYKTIDIAMRGGQDSDCNPSSAGGILGVILGYRGIPAKWTEPLGALADKKFSYTGYSYNSIVQSTIERAKQVVKLQGGAVTSTSFEIPEQKPMSLELEQFRPGHVVERIELSDPRWKFQGSWQKASSDRPEMKSNTGGAGAAVTFEGTGAMLVGRLDTDGGLADLYLDGKRMAVVDGYNDDGNRTGEGYWGEFDMPQGRHTLRVVVKGQPYPGSKGAWIYLEDLVVFRK
jgi:hypothetical protein